MKEPGGRAVDEKRNYGGGGGRGSLEDDAPSRHLWVGNVAMGAPESVVREMFGKFGELETVTVYPMRQYAFVNFRKQEDAERAKEALLGAHISGQTLRIEFAKGARPSRHLWVVGISPSVTKEMLEAEFQKHGQLEDFKLTKDKTAALVEYLRTDDAISAIAALNGKRFGDEELRIDYKSNAPKRQQQTGGSAAAAPASVSPRGNGKDEPPSEILWIGLPGNAKFDEESLHKLFMPYGDVVRVKLFASRSYCFVEFRSVREAALAKNALSGKSVNGHRLQIEFSTSDVGPVEDPAALTDSKKAKLSPGVEQPIRPRLSSPFLPLPVPENGSWGWQGLIAKCGLVVCQVRGFPAAGRVETVVIPEVVNCTARTDLEVLAKHVYPSGGEFNVILFQPVREMDVTPYHDLLQYLREKRRAGVAKVGESTTMFLVPPSAFSEKVLKITRTDCLFGVLLNSHHHHPQQQQQQQQTLHFQQQSQPGSFNLTPELIASIYQQQQPQQQPPLPPPGFNDQLQFHQQQQQQGPPLLDQFAQLSALLKQSQQQQPNQEQQQQQQQHQQQNSWLPALAAQQQPVNPPPPPPPVVSAALPAQFQGDPEMLQRTLALAAQLLSQRNS